MKTIEKISLLVPVRFSAVHNTDSGRRIHESPQPVVGEAPSRESLTSDSSNGVER